LSLHGVKNLNIVFFAVGRKYIEFLFVFVVDWLIFYAHDTSIRSCVLLDIQRTVSRRTRIGLPEFFAKYATYNQVSESIVTILSARFVEREAYWRNRSEAILSENRLQTLSDRVQMKRNAIIERWLAKAEVLLDRFLPKVDQAAIDKRIADYVKKLLQAFEESSKQTRDQWKAIFKAIDDATKGDENKWFRTLVADIDSNKFATDADTESTKVFKKLGDSSKLLINNIQKLSRRMTQRNEATREYVKNAIRHLPKVCSLSIIFQLICSSCALL
jgi:hypothetical protein